MRRCRAGRGRLTLILRIFPGSPTICLLSGYPIGSGWNREIRREIMSTNTEETYTQPIGLDVGTSRIVVARTQGKRYSYDAQLNAFFTLPHSRLTESMLQRENVVYAVKDGRIIVAGNDSERLAEVFHAETRRPMKEGVLNAQEPYAIDVIRMIMGRLLGNSATPGQ